GAVATGPSVSHEYATDGVRNVTLSIENGAGQTSTWTETIAVDGTPPVVRNLTQGLLPQDAALPVNVRVNAYDGMGFGSVALRWSRDGGAESTVPMSRVSIPLPTGLVAWWRGEDSFADASGAHPGTPVGNVGFADGLVGRAIRVTDGGPANHVRVAHHPALSFGASEPHTIELWMNETAGRGLHHILGKRVGCNGDPNDFNYQMAEVDGAGGYVFTPVGSNVALPSNRWVHLAGTYDGATHRLYVDGALVATQVAGPRAENAAALLLGASGACVGFEGLLDEVTVYSRALSAAEILAIAQAGASGKAHDGGGTLWQANVPATTTAANVTYYVTAVDALGNVANTSAAGYVTSQRPVVGAIARAPLHPRVDEPVDVTAAVTDDSGVAAAVLNYTVDHAARPEVPLAPVDGLWRGAIPPAGANATVRFTVRATDVHGLGASSGQQLYAADSRPPTLSARFTPASPAGVSTVRVEAFPGDANGVERVDLAWSFDGGNVTVSPMTRQSSSHYTLDLPPFGANGWLFVNGTAYDPANNSATVAASVFVDADAPVLAGLTDGLPPQRADVGVPLQANATDNVGVASVTLHYNYSGGANQTRAFSRGAGSLWTVTLPASGTAATVRYHAVARDAA
ncbi:MAG TPA: LamG domain-containing protein, partial [Candidatus Thermoplasmatota archaeon]|nr:LamG domain-containing protein [Candidatus Thermoplasmatota archaeon]